MGVKMIPLNPNRLIQLASVIWLCSIIVKANDEQQQQQQKHQASPGYTQTSRRNQSPMTNDNKSSHSSNGSNQHVRTNLQQEARNAQLTRAPSSNFSSSKQNQTISKRSQVANGPMADNQYQASSWPQQQQQQQLADTRVPFWNIAHMINSIDQVEVALSAGSNGIETDVSFNSQGVPIEAYHGFPCDCGRHCHFREDLVRFVQHIGKITSPSSGTRLLVVLFDLKLKDLRDLRQKQTAGLHLAKLIYENIYSKYETAMRRLRSDELPMAQPPVRTIISINHATDLDLVRAFLGYMRDNRLDLMHKFVGFDVGMNDKLDNITSMWDELNGATFNIWQGDGLTNCANLVRGVERLKEAISIRNGQGHFRKIYYWTADILYHIRSVLRLGIDAVLTNQPQRVLQVLQEDEFRPKYRLATPFDDPYDQFWIKPSAWKMSVPTIGEAVETVTNIHKTSTNFVKTLPDGISAAFKKVHSSISSAIR